MNKNNNNNNTRNSSNYKLKTNELFNVFEDNFNFNHHQTNDQQSFKQLEQHVDENHFNNITSQPYTSFLTRFKSILSTNMHSFLFLFAIWTVILVFVNFSLHSASQIYTKETNELFDRVNVNCAEKSNNSAIVDFSNGSLSSIHDSIEKYQLTCIYLYAHWCARSISYKELMSKLACKHSKEISFVAVNCFNPSGDCRKAFTMHRYPQIVINIRDVGLYNYLGPHEFNYLSNHIDLLQKPIRRIDSLEQFAEFVLLNDGVLIGNFNFSNKNESQLYKTFYEASIKSISGDNENSIQYGVVLNVSLWNQILNLKPIGTKNSKKYVKTKIIYFSSLGFKKVIRNHPNITSNQIINFSTKFSQSLTKWYYPDKAIRESTQQNRLLIFVPRHFQHSSETKKYTLIVKYLMYESERDSVRRNESYAVYEFLRRYLLDNFVGHCCTRESFSLYLSNFVNFGQKAAPVCHGDKLEYLYEQFVRQTEIDLVDANLYAKYAENLLTKTSLKPIKYPTAIFIDYKNETMFHFEDEFNYKNLKKFLERQFFGSNGRHLRSKNIQTANSHRLATINEINSLELDSILSNNQTSYSNQDILIFYYNNWCGFCNLVNHNLILLKLKYFTHTDTFRILKVDVNLNDFKWYLHVDKVPSLVLIPAETRRNDDRSINVRDTIAYDLAGNQIDLKHLIRFILFNSKNPNTLLKFLTDNYLRPNNVTISKNSSSKLRYDLISLVSTKEAQINREVDKLNQYLTNSTIGRLDHHLNDHQANFYLKSKLNKYLHQLDVLRNFTHLY